MQNKPLDGIRVVDLTQIYQGPYATFLMAMAGAEVIKVEPRTGERMRGLGGDRTPMAFVMLNSNKKSITLDLKTEAGAALLRKLAAEADVLVENFAPGVMDRLGVGWDDLKQVNPQLIYGTGTGYGLSGPDRDMLAMDHTIQAASGVMSVTGDADRPPARSGGAPCDIMGGIHLYAGIMAALVGRFKHGHGTRVEVSMLEAMYFTLCSEFTAYHAAGGKLPPRNSARSPAGACPYGRYACTDGYIAIICVAEAHWQNIASVIGRPDLFGADDYINPARRKRRESEIDSMIEAWSAPLTRDEAYRQMRDARVPVAPVRDIEEVRTDPHLHERGMLSWMNHPDLGDLVMPSSPIRYSDFDISDVAFFPPVGEHNFEVYSGWLGLSEAELSDLLERQVI